eukprot:2184516-Pleurochrysis_carterae.AAC.1
MCSLHTPSSRVRWLHVFGVTVAVSVGPWRRSSSLAAIIASGAVATRRIPRYGKLLPLGTNI